MELHNNSTLFYCTSNTHSQTWSVNERSEFDRHVIQFPQQGLHTLGTIGCGLLLGTLLIVNCTHNLAFQLLNVCLIVPIITNKNAVSRWKWKPLSYFIWITDLMMDRTNAELKIRLYKFYTFVKVCTNGVMSAAIHWYALNWTQF